MFTFEIKGNISELPRSIRELREFPAAASAAANRTVTAIRRAAIKSIAAELGLKQKGISDVLTIQKATRSKLEAKVIATGKGIPAIFLKPKPSRIIRPQPGIGVSFKVGSARHLVVGGFIAMMHKHLGIKRLGVWVRTTEDRFPVKYIRGPSIPEVFAEERIQKSLINLVDERLPKELDQALKFFMGRTA